MLRWKAPELVDEREGKANKKSDIWAFGMMLLVSELEVASMSTVPELMTLIPGIAHEGCPLQRNERQSSRSELGLRHPACSAR